MIANKEHGTLGNNVKVHYAGVEGTEKAFIAHDAGVHYFLFTVLPFIKDQFGIKWAYISSSKHMKPVTELKKISKHTIMDSGLFSLMFGACKDLHPDEKFVQLYMDAICSFIHENQAYDLTCVECDCQKLLGVDFAWHLRKQFRKNIPNKIINVFHFEDGLYGLDKLIEFSEYIAISVPELRIVKPKTYKEDTYKIAKYIKNKKPEIDIHLLGGTEFDLLKRCKFCTSADSTSWLSVNRFGNVLGKKTSTLNPAKKHQILQRIKTLFKQLDIDENEKRINYYSNWWISAHLYKQKYVEYAGDQE